MHRFKTISGRKRPVGLRRAKGIILKLGAKFPTFVFFLDEVDIPPLTPLAISTYQLNLIYIPMLHYTTPVFRCSRMDKEFQ